MTREEAIDFGEMWLDVNEDTKDSDTYMFIELATKALEQQPCDDAISRADVLEFLKGFEILHNHDELRTNLIYGIMSLSPVTPQQTRWIPVSERLPKYGKDVLTCSNDGFIEIQSIENDVWDEYNYWENQNGAWSDFDEVIAWQPLPEPYKAESEDKE